MMYSFGKMRRPLKASVCAKVEAAVVACPSTFKDLEVSNILYGFVKTRYNSPELLSIMEQRYAPSTFYRFCTSCLIALPCDQIWM